MFQLVRDPCVADAAWHLVRSVRTDKVEERKQWDATMRDSIVLDHSVHQTVCAKTCACHLLTDPVRPSVYRMMMFLHRMPPREYDEYIENETYRWNPSTKSPCSDCISLQTFTTDTVPNCNE